MLPRSLLPFPLYCTIYPFHFLLSFFLCTSRVTCCLFFPNGWLLATGALDGKFFLFDAFSGKCVSKKRTSIHDGGINTIALQPFELGDTSSVNQSLPKPDQFSTGGQNYHCATAGNDYTTKIWKIRESPIDGNSKCLRYRNQLLNQSELWPMHFAMQSFAAATKFCRLYCQKGLGNRWIHLVLWFTQLHGLYRT